MPTTVLITGANRGIGLALAEHYHRQGWQVIGVCRSEACETSDLSTVAQHIYGGIDLTQAADIAQLASDLTGQRLDVLINNAGLLQEEVLGAVDFDSLRLQMEVNAFAPLRLTEALLNNLASGSKIANITSRMGSIADNSSGGSYGYRASKAAFNAIGKSLAEDLKPRGIAVAQIHPGYVQTRMVNFSGLISPAAAAAGISARIEQLSLTNSGGFWHSNGEPLPW